MIGPSVPAHAASAAPNARLVPGMTLMLEGDEAALGAAIKVPTLGGAPVTLKIPAGTPNGRTFRVRGRGAQKPDGTKGDLLATVLVQVPARLNEAAREAITAYRAAAIDGTLRANLFEPS